MHFLAEGLQFIARQLAVLVGVGSVEVLKHFLLVLHKFISRNDAIMVGIGTAKRTAVVALAMMHLVGHRL